MQGISSQTEKARLLLCLSKCDADSAQTVASEKKVDSRELRLLPNMPRLSLAGSRSSDSSAQGEIYTTKVSRTGANTSLSIRKVVLIHNSII